MNYDLPLEAYDPNLRRDRRRLDAAAHPLTRDQVSSELHPLVDAYERALPPYLEASRPFWVETLGIRSGTLTNLESGMAWMMAKAGELLSHIPSPGQPDPQEFSEMADESLKAGCIACQSKTLAVLRQAKEAHRIDGWLLHRYMVGNGFEHHAVLVKPVHGQGDPVIFDPWIHQRPEIYRVEGWHWIFSNLQVLGSARVE